MGHDWMARDPFDLVGDTLDGQFRVVAFVGEGDLSVVYKGHHIGVDAPVAIKCLDLPTTLDGALVRPLVESFREASRLHYKLARGNLNIAQSIGGGSTLAPATGMIVPYLVREWFEGESLRADLARRRGEGKKGRTIDEAIALLEPAVDAVAYAHAQGALHLSLSPSNLFLAERDGERSLKVLDFGVARAMNDLAQEIPLGARPAGLRVLFPAYAAPEQLDATAGKPGASTDVYALALLLMELLSDRVVMGETEARLLAARALDEQRRPTPHAHGLELPRNLELVLIRAVARAPERRQKNAAAFWKDVKTSLRGGTTSRGMSATPGPASLPPASAPAPSPAVVGAVPSRRLMMPVVPSMETIPMGFDVQPPSGPTYVVNVPVIAAIEQQSEQAAVHAVTTPLPPQPTAPVLPPVIVDVDSPPPPRAAASPPFPIRPLPSPTFPILEKPAPRRRSTAILASLLAAAVGGSLGVGVVVVLKRQALTHVRVGPSLTTPSSASVSALPPPGTTAPPLPPAPTSSSEPGHDPAPPSAPAAAPLAHFPAAAAKQALEAASRDLARCRLGKVWGIATATVTFANDGTVSQVVVSIPFTGTTTGQCVSDALKTAQAPAFAGKPGVVAYRFLVPGK
jgi:serine/threonine protein kinase